MTRLVIGIACAFLLAGTPAHADSASEHVAAARRAGILKNWKKALEEWRAAYQASGDAECLVGMGDAYAGLGDKANAKKQYMAYLADPLALDGEAVKGKLAALNKEGGEGLALDLDTVPATKPKRRRTNAPVAATDDSGLELSVVPIPAPKPAPARAKASAPVADLGLDLEGVPAPKPEAKKPQTKAAPADLGLSLDLPLGPVKPGAGSQPQGSSSANVAVAIAEAPKPAVASEAAPEASVSSRGPLPPRASGGTRTLAWVAAGVAVAGLGGSVFMLTRASSAQSDLHSGIRSSGDNADLISREQSSKNISLGCVLVGAAAAGTAIALFVF